MDRNHHNPCGSLRLSMPSLSGPSTKANPSQPKLWTMVESGLQIWGSSNCFMTGYEKWTCDLRGLFQSRTDPSRGHVDVSLGESSHESASGQMRSCGSRSCLLVDLNHSTRCRWNRIIPRPGRFAERTTKLVGTTMLLSFHSTWCAHGSSQNNPQQRQRPKLMDLRHQTRRPLRHTSPRHLTTHPGSRSPLPKLRIQALERLRAHSRQFHSRPLRPLRRTGIRRKHVQRSLTLYRLPHYLTLQSNQPLHQRLRQQTRVRHRKRQAPVPVRPEHL